jgi:peptide/nickel transport system substrate-binding protein
MNMKHRSWRWFAVLAVLALAVTACSPDDAATTTTAADGPTTTAAPGDTTTTTPPVEADPGLEGCAERPLTCNSGERAAGGDVNFIINQVWDGWNHWRPEGGSVYTFQAVEGMQATIGQFAPDGTWQWDMDTLAEEPVLLSEDPLTIQYVLSDDAVWHNGDGTTTPITGDDFLFSWYHNSGNPDQCLHEDQEDEEGETVSVNLCAPRSTQRTEDVESVEVSDDGKTVVVTFPAGYAYPEWFAFLGAFYYPAHIAMAEGHDWTTPEGMASASVFFNTTTPYWSGGPYVIENATVGERVVMVPNPDWYGETQVTLDTLTKTVDSEQGGWLTALVNRDIHGGAPASFPVDLVTQLEGTDGVYHAVGSGGAVWDHVDMNMDHPALGDVVLRQAIFTALDREDARTRIFGGIIEPPFRNNHIFPQSNVSYYEDKIEGTGYGSGDVAAATALLEAAGYTGMDGGPGALTTPDGTAVGPLRFSWVAGNTNRENFVALSQDYLGAIGIEVVPYPSEALGATLGGQDYDMVIFGWSGSPLFTAAPGQFWRSDSGSNFGKMVNTDIDALVDQVGDQVDIADSAALANDAVELVMEEAYSLPLWDTLNLMFVVEELANIRDNHFNSLRSFYNVAEWGFVN